MKKEWLFQLIALIIFYLDSIIEVDHHGVYISSIPGIYLLFLLYEALLFFAVNYILIPKFFYKKKYIIFFASVIGLIALFGVVEEGIVEKILTPDSRGKNDVTWQSIYWFFGEVLIPLLTFVTIKFVFDNFEHQQKLERIEQDRLINELKLLKSQIQPHILFNSLNNLYHFALNQSNEVPGLILKLSNVLRYVLYEAGDEKVSLSKELSFIKDYVDLQKIQYEGRGKIQCNIKNEDNDKHTKIAPFLLIPFIENSFKHSFGTKVKNVFVEIEILIDQQRLNLFTKNNFEKNNSQDETLTQGGIGLSNVKKRLNLLYPDQHSINIIENQNVYHTHLEIELFKISLN